jgi:WXG100 family type VII secretion target
VAQTQSDAAVMANVAAKFDSTNDSLQSMLSTLMSELSALGGTWKGLGATAFEQVKSQYAADLKTLNQALSETAQSIRESGKGYTAVDTDSASNVASTGGNFQLPL